MKSDRSTPRAAALLAWLLLWAGCVSMADAAHPLQTRLQALAQRARPGLLGVTVLDLRSDASWQVNASRPYPMMSVLKLPIAATVLARIDEHSMSLGQSITLTRAELRGGRSSIANTFQGESMTYTLDQMLTYAVSLSDNTAADALLKAVGGPAAVMSFLRAHGIEGMRVDIDERDIAQIFEHAGNAQQPAADETAAARTQRLQAGYQAFMADPRNRSTPSAAADFLRKLWRNQLLSRASTQQLLNLMFAQTQPTRLRGGIPADVRLADKSGTSDTVSGAVAAFNDIGILVWPDGHSAIIAAFLSGSSATDAQRDELFANLAQEVAKALAPDAH